MSNSPPLVDDYKNAGFGGSLDFGAKGGLLLIDMVRAYLDPSCPLYLETAAGALKQATKLSSLFVERGWPIILTTVCYDVGMKTAGLFYKKAPVLKHFEQGSKFATLPRELSRLPDAIQISKNYASAFFGTSLASTLRTEGIDTVIIAGFSTSGCVRASALDALQNGFSPFIASDACADRDEAPHQASLFDLQSKYAEVARTDELIHRCTSSWISSL